MNAPDVVRAGVAEQLAAQGLPCSAEEIDELTQTMLSMRERAALCDRALAGEPDSDLAGGH
ncbi:hypothetical protein [Dactylosporangium sp. CA-092794]|uniref:hypothetical protein n=1 Tax=Dactylosporangium sp. CA-092794 TaxID=3239929 RepID=UPI003D8F16E3